MSLLSCIPVEKEKIWAEKCANVHNAVSKSLSELKTLYKQAEESFSSVALYEKASDNTESGLTNNDNKSEKPPVEAEFFQAKLDKIVGLISHMQEIVLQQVVISIKFINFSFF